MFEPQEMQTCTHPPSPSCMPRSGFSKLESFKLEGLVLHELLKRRDLDALQLYVKVLWRFELCEGSTSERIRCMGADVDFALRARQIWVPFGDFCDQVGHCASPVVP